jgi:RNA polymerase sigma-70 factor (ECF subfamily)
MADTDALSDAACVERARRGDIAAFEALVRRHYRAAYAVALSVAGNRFDAEDVCQDAFIRAADHLHECREPAKFASWLLRIVRNRALNLRDYQRVRASVPLDDGTAAIGGAAERNIEREELRTRLETALSHLSRIQREVVLLHDLEGWKHRKIAEALGMSEGMSRQHLFAARRLLRQQLGHYVLGECANE